MGKCTTISSVIIVVIATIIGMIRYSGPFDPALCRFTFRTIGCPQVIINGSVAPGYESVREAFSIQFREGYSLGAQLVLWKDGKEVVNLYGSYGEEGYTDNTLQIMFSSTKVYAPMCIAKLMDQGLLDLHDKVSKHWPEFANNGKENITITEILRHESGLDGFSEAIPWETFNNPDDHPTMPMHKVIEQSTQLYYKDYKRVYHAVTIGYLLNEIVKRVDPKKRTIGQFFADEFAKPLNVEFFIGLPDDKFQHMVTNQQTPEFYTTLKYLLPYLITGTASDPLIDHMFDSFNGNKEVLANLRVMKTIQWPDGVTNQIPFYWSRPILKTVHPALNGVSNAKSKAKILRLLANLGELDGVRYLKKETMEKMFKLSSTPLKDGLLNITLQFCDGGWAHFNEFFGLNKFWGWGGLGGSVTTFSPEKNSVFVYLMNGMAPGILGDSRTQGQIIPSLPKEFSG